MPAGKRANYRSFSIRKVVEWALPMLLSLWALVVLVTSSGVGPFASKRNQNNSSANREPAL
jgi:hypothetical protein